MMSISTCCRISDAESQSLRAGSCQHRPYVFVLPKAPARLAAASLSAATCALRVRVCEWLHHHRGACAAGACEPEPLCLSVSRTHGLSPVLYPLGRTSSPRNTVFGHAIGLVCGYAAFAATGAGALPFREHLGIFWPRVLAAAQIGRA